MHKALKALSLTVAIAAPLGLAVAQTKVSKERHPNLAAAQKLSAQAYEKLEAAQKAKDLLKAANDEIKLAAEAANKNGK